MLPPRIILYFLYLIYILYNNFFEKSNWNLAAWGRSVFIPFFYIITYFYIKIKRAIALINYGKHMDVGPIARSETKISYGRADREFRCSRADRDRLDMIEAIWVVITGKNRENEKIARSLQTFAYGVGDRKIGPCLPSAARFSIAHPAALVKGCFAQRKEPHLGVQFKHALPSHHRRSHRPLPKKF